VDRDYEDPSTFDSEEIRCNWILNYAAMIEDLDTTFGTLLQTLTELGIEDRTYVFFTSDNGGGLRGNAPLRGAKADLPEGGIRIPLVVRGPGVLAGVYCDEPVVGWDLLPTFSDLAGNTQPLPDVLDGGSFRSLLERGNQGTVVRGNDALIFHFPWYNGEPESAIRMGPYKLLKNLDTRELSLYDVSRDLGEQQDLAKTMPEKTADLHQRLTRYLDDVGAEDVQTLRHGFRERVVNEWIPNWEQKLARLRADVDAGDRSQVKALEKAERHVTFLKEQVVFTDERSALHE
jgi:arylsulfatase A-like enzyme